MGKLITIQTNVPRCPECESAMVLSPINLVYFCTGCKNRYKVIDHGHTEREFICEKIKG